MKKAGIIGAGLLGRLLAWRLLQKNWQVTLFDKDAKTGEQSCAYAGGGMLSPLAELETSEKIIYELGMQSLKLWPDYLQSLQQQIYYKQNGSLFIAFNNDKDNLNNLLVLLQQKKLIAGVDRIDKQQLSKLEPELPHIHHAIYLPEEAHINPWQLLNALQMNLEKNITWHDNTEVCDIQAKQISTRSQQYNFDCVFDCRGIGAKSAIQNLRGVRGEALLVHAPEVNLTRPIRLLHPRYRIYIVPRGENYYYIGASEIESEVKQNITIKTCLELLTATYHLHPGFAEACIVKNLVNFRPAMLDNLPLVDFSPGIVRINGLYRHGFLLAPALIENVIFTLEEKYYASVR